MYHRVYKLINSKLYTEVIYSKYSFVDLKKDFMEEFWVIFILMSKIQTIFVHLKGGIILDNFIKQFYNRANLYFKN